MSFVSDIFSSVTDGFSTILGIGKKVVGGVGDVLNASGISTLLTLVTSITNDIDSLVKSIDVNLGGIISPITDVVKSVETLSHDITDRIINPIIKPIADTVTEIQGLSKTIDRLVDQGLSGIIKIPEAIANALTGIEANWDRATALLAKANADVAANILGPAMKDAVAPGLEKLNEAFLTFNKNTGLNVEQFGRVEIPENAGDAFNEANFREIAQRVNDPKDWFDKLIASIINSIRYVVGISSEMIEFIDRGREQANVANPQKPLDVGSAIGLFNLGILNRGDAETEAAKNGLNPARFQALVAGSKYLPGADEAIAWALKGIITAKERDDVLAKRGYNDDAARAAVAGAYVTVPPETALNWLARDIIDAAAFDSAMRAQGLSDSTIKHFAADALSEPQVNTAINSHWNEYAALGGWFPETYASIPPDEVVKAGKRTRVDPEETLRRWRSQFAPMPITTAIALFFRGEMTRAEVEIVVVQNGFPRDMTKLLIISQTPLIPARSIPTLVARGEITKSEGTDRLIARGFTLEDAVLLIAAATDSDPSGTTAPPTDESKLTVAQIRAAYKDGLVDEGVARELMGLQGLTPADIEFYIAQDNYDINLKAVTDEIDTLKSEVTLGVLSIDDATQRLFDMALPEQQVAKTLVALQQAQRANAKIPDLTMLTKMAKQGIITQDDYLAGVQALGYSDPWDQRVVALNLGSGSSPDGQ